MKQYGPGVLALLLAAGACSDGPSAPAAQAAAAVEAAAGDGQTAEPGARVGVAPTVLVRSAAGRPLADVRVEFSVTRGGGSVGAALARTDAEGVATAGSWTLGPEPGVNQVQARAGTATPVVFTATAVAAAPPGAGPPGSYSIDIRWVGQGATVRQQSAVSAAVARWRSVVVSNLPEIPMVVAAGSCFAGQPALNEVVDDLLIFVEFVALDGPGKVLGEAGPCYVRSESGLPVVGYLKLDVADLEMMERAGTLDDVVLHEIGHILGIGTLWNMRGLLTGAGGSDPGFTGAHALAEYHALGGIMTTVPVENTGAAGTRDGHWREADFGNELMTPFISGTPNPLSALTVASLTDLGYGASSSGASAYTLGGTHQRLSEPIDLRGRERIHGPKFKVDRRGRQEKLDLPSRAAGGAARRP